MFSSSKLKLEMFRFLHQFFCKIQNFAFSTSYVFSHDLKHVMYLGTFLQQLKPSSLQSLLWAVGLPSALCPIKTAVFNISSSSASSAGSRLKKNCRRWICVISSIYSLLKFFLIFKFIFKILTSIF